MATREELLAELDAIEGNQQEEPEEQTWIPKLPKAKFDPAGPKPLPDETVGEIAARSPDAGTWQEYKDDPLKALWKYRGTPALVNFWKKQYATTFDDKEMYEEATGNKWYSNAELKHLPPNEALRARQEQENALMSLKREFKAFPQFVVDASAGLLNRAAGAYNEGGGEQLLKDTGRFGKQVGVNFATGIRESMLDPMGKAHRTPFEFLGDVSVVGGAVAGQMGKMAAKKAGVTSAGYQKMAGKLAKERFQQSIAPTTVAKKGAGTLADAWGKLTGNPDAPASIMQWIADPDYGLSNQQKLATGKYIYAADGGAMEAKLWAQDMLGAIDPADRKLFEELVSEPSRLSKNMAALDEDALLIKDHLKSEYLKINGPSAGAQAEAFASDSLRKVIDNPEAFDTLRALTFGDMKKAGTLPAGYKFSPQMARRTEQARRLLTVDFIHMPTGKRMTEAGFVRYAAENPIDATDIRIWVADGAKNNPFIKKYVKEMQDYRRFMVNLAERETNIISGYTFDKFGNPVAANRLRDPNTYARRAAGYTRDRYDFTPEDVGKIQRGALISPSDLGHQKRSKYKHLKYESKLKKGLQPMEEHHDYSMFERARAANRLEALMEIKKTPGAAMTPREYAAFKARYPKMAHSYKKIGPSKIKDTGGVSRFGALEGHYVYKPILRKLDFALREEGKVGEFFRRLTTAKKGLWVVANPGSHMNMYIDNTIKLALNGITPAAYRKAFRHMKGKTPLWRAYVGSGVSAGGHRGLEVPEMPSNWRAYASGRNAVQAVKNGMKHVMDPTANLAERGLRAFEFASHDVAQVGGLMGRAFSGGEDLFKFSIFEDELSSLAKMHKMTPEMAAMNSNLVNIAARKANRWGLDYNNMPILNQRLSRYGVVPFTGFAWKASGLYADLAARSPLAYLATKRISQAVQDDKSAEWIERESQAPDYRHGRTAVVDEIAKILGVNEPVDLGLHWAIGVPHLPEDMWGAGGLGKQGKGLLEPTPAANKIPGVVGEFVRPVFGENAFGQEIDGWDRVLEAAQIAMPGWTRQVYGGLFPAYLGRKDYRGEERSKAQAWLRLVGVRAYTPQKMQLGREAVRAFEELKADAYGDLLRSWRQYNSDTDYDKRLRERAKERYIKRMKEGAEKVREMTSKNLIGGYTE